jgi:hypothetical protein
MGLPNRMVSITANRRWSNKGAREAFFKTIVWPEAVIGAEPVTPRLAPPGRTEPSEMPWACSSKRRVNA